MDASEKWIIIWFTPNQTLTLPIWMFFQELFFKSSLLVNGQCGIQVRPSSSNDFCLFSSVCLFFYVHHHQAAEKYKIVGLRLGWVWRWKLALLCSIMCDNMVWLPVCPPEESNPSQSMLLPFIKTINQGFKPNNPMCRMCLPASLITIVGHR